MKTVQIILLLLFCSLLNVYGQVTTVTKEKYEKLYEFTEKVWTVPHRKTTRSVRYKKGKITSSRTNIISSENTARRHYIYSTSEIGKDKVTTERIYYDGREFKKAHGEDWSEIENKVFVLMFPFLKERLLLA